MVQFTFLVGLGLAVACILCCLCQPSASNLRVCRPKSHNLRVCGYKYYADRHNATETHRETYCTCTRDLNDCPFDQNNANHKIPITNPEEGNSAVHELIFCEPLEWKRFVCSTYETSAVYEGRKRFPWKINCPCSKLNNTGPGAMKPDNPLGLEGPIIGNGTHSFSCQVVVCPNSRHRLCGFKYYADARLEKELKRGRLCTCKPGRDECPLDQDGAHNVTTIFRYNGSLIYTSNVFCEELPNRICREWKKSVTVATYNLTHDPSVMEVRCLCNSSYKGGHLVLMPKNDMRFVIVEFSCQVKPTPCKRKVKGLRWCGIEGFHPLTEERLIKKRICSCQKEEHVCPFNNDSHSITMSSNYRKKQNTFVHVFCEEVTKKKVCRPGKKAAKVIMKRNKGRQTPEAVQVIILCQCTNNGPMELKMQKLNPKKRRTVAVYLCQNAMPKCRPDQVCFTYNKKKANKMLKVECLCPFSNVCKGKSRQKGRIYKGHCQLKECSIVTNRVLWCGQIQLNTMNGSEYRHTHCKCPKGDCPFDQKNHSITLLSKIQDTLVLVFCKTLQQELCSTPLQTAVARYLGTTNIMATEFKCRCNGPLEMFSWQKNVTDDVEKYACQEHMPQCQEKDVCFSVSNRTEPTRTRSTYDVHCLCPAPTTCLHWNNEPKIRRSAEENFQGKCRPSPP